MVSQIYPTELQLNTANEAPLLDLALMITNGIVSFEIYDKPEKIYF